MPNPVTVVPVGSGTSILVSWADSSSDETAFVVVRTTDPVGETGWTTVQTTAANVTSFTDSGLKVGIAYRYRVKARNASGDSLGQPGGVGFYRVFATSSTHQGDFGGVEAADSICQTRANAASLSGDWKAVLFGGQGTMPRNNLNLGGGMYNMRPTGSGRPVSLGGICPSSLISAVGFDESGNSVTGSAWTGAANCSTTTATNTCTSWTSTTGNGRRGTVTSSTSSWLVATDGTCVTANRLYCINGQPGPTAPINPKIKLLSGKSVQIDWTDQSTSETGYAVERATSDDLLWRPVLLSTVSLPANSVQYVDDASSESVGQLGYRIRASKRGVLSSGSFFGLNWGGGSNIVPVSNPHYVFVTSTTPTGNLGGLAGADAICSTRASAGGWAGTWKAVLSSGSTTASSRISINGPVYDSYINFGQSNFIAGSHADFFSGILANGIQYNELSATITGSAWTGSTATGGSAAIRCADWTTTAGAGMRGALNVFNSTWISNGTSGCTGPNRLYCIDGQ